MSIIAYIALNQKQGWHVTMCIPMESKKAKKKEAMKGNITSVHHETFTRRSMGGGCWSS